MRPAKTLYAFPAPLERRRLRVAGVSAFAAFIYFIALSTFIAFSAGIIIIRAGELIMKGVRRQRLTGCTTMMTMMFRSFFSELVGAEQSMPSYFATDALPLVLLSR